MTPWLRTHGREERTLAAVMLRVQAQQRDAVLKDLPMALLDVPENATREWGRIVADRVFSPEAWHEAFWEAVRPVLMRQMVRGAQDELDDYEKLSAKGNVRAQSVRARSLAVVQTKGPNPAADRLAGFGALLPFVMGGIGTAMDDPSSRSGRQWQTSARTQKAL